MGLLPAINPRKHILTVKNSHNRAIIIIIYFLLPNQKKGTNNFLLFYSRKFMKLLYVKKFNKNIFCARPDIENKLHFPLLRFPYFKRMSALHNVIIYLSTSIFHIFSINFLPQGKTARSLIFFSLIFCDINHDKVKGKKIEKQGKLKEVFIFGNFLTKFGDFSIVSGMSSD